MKKSDTKGHRIHDFIDIKCPDWANSETESRVVVAGAGGRGEQVTVNGYGFLSGVMEKDYS